jgi:hypothetical protein
MREDMGFHRSLIYRLPCRLRNHHGLAWKTRIISAVLLWEVVNALGFLYEAASQTFAGRQANACTRSDH